MKLRHNPVALVLTRQALPTLDRKKYAAAAGLEKGGYILADTPEGMPEVILIGTGSEVSLCVEAFQQLSSEGIKARVVSLPSWELFARQTQEYRDSVLPPDVVARVGVEQASTLGWERFIGSKGLMIGMGTFGTSAPLKDVQKKFGFLSESVAEAAKRLVRT